MLHGQVHESTQNDVVFLLPPDSFQLIQTSDQLMGCIIQSCKLETEIKQTEEVVEVLGFNYLHIHRENNQYDTKAPNSPTPLQHHHNNGAEKRLQCLTCSDANI